MSIGDGTMGGPSVWSAKAYVNVQNRFNLAQVPVAAVSAGTSAYTNNTGGQVVITDLILCEISGANTTFSIRHLPSGTTAPGTTANNLATGASGTAEVLANDTLFFLDSGDTIVLDPGDVLWIGAAASSRLVATIYGLKP